MCWPCCWPCIDVVEDSPPQHTISRHPGPAFKEVATTRGATSRHTMSRRQAIRQVAATRGLESRRTAPRRRATKQVTATSRSTPREIVPRPSVVGRNSLSQETVSSHPAMEQVSNTIVREPAPPRQPASHLLKNRPHIHLPDSMVRRPSLASIVMVTICYLLSEVYLTVTVYYLGFGSS